METKKKEINVGISDELLNLINTWAEKSFELAEKYKEKEEKEEKIGDEVKREIVDITVNELKKLRKGFEKEDLTDDDWFSIMNKVDKISDIVRFY